MENKRSPILEVPGELFHTHLEILILIRINGKPVTIEADPIDCIEIGKGIKVKEIKASH